MVFLLIDQMHIGEGQNDILNFALGFIDVEEKWCSLMVHVFIAHVLNKIMQSPQLKTTKGVASVHKNNPFQTLFEGFIAGGTAGFVVDTALYPIDRYSSSWRWEIVFKGLYSGLAGNVPSALFIGVYEPTKQKLLKDPQ